MPKFGIQFGKLSNQIYIGRINKAQSEFLDGKEEASYPAVHAVAEYVLANHPTDKDGEGGMWITTPDGVRYGIDVQRLTSDVDAVSNRSV